MTDHPSSAPRATRLAALPDCEPPPSAWRGIEARLDAPRRHPGQRRALAAGAAALVLAALLVPGIRGGAPSVPPPAARPLVDRELDARASRLTELLAALPDTRHERASTGLATSLLEERLAAVDERLGRSGVLPPAATDDLKRERLVLLDSLVRVKYASAVAVSL